MVIALEEAPWVVDHLEAELVLQKLYLEESESSAPKFVSGCSHSPRKR